MYHLVQSCRLVYLFLGQSEVCGFLRVEMNALLPPFIFLQTGQLFASCRDVQMRLGVKIDGEYHLKVKSRILQVCLFCQDMTLHPPPMGRPFRFPHSLSFIVSMCLASDLLC